jgi:hypothetical protein
MVCVYRIPQGEASHGGTTGISYTSSAATARLSRYQFRVKLKIALQLKIDRLAAVRTIPMRSLWTAPFLVVPLVAGATAPDKATTSAPGAWRAIFDGKSLDGWEHVGPGKMVVKDGMIQTEGGMGLLWYTKEKFGNCVIRVVYKTTSPSSNSGVFIRVAEKPKDEWYAVHHGYEVQICDVQDEFHGTGSLYSLSKSKARPARPAGEWNTLEITLKGQRVMVTVNGTLVTDFDAETADVPKRTKDYEPKRGPRPESGYIGLQNHDDYSREAHVVFKDVSVRDLTTGADR